MCVCVSGQVDRGHGAMVEEGEFPCPLCRGLGNTLVPILPAEPGQQDAVAAETVVEKAVLAGEGGEGGGAPEGGERARDLAELSVAQLKQVCRALLLLSAKSGSP